MCKSWTTQEHSAIPTTQECNQRQSNVLGPTRNKWLGLRHLMTVAKVTNKWLTVARSSSSCQRNRHHIQSLLVAPPITFILRSQSAQKVMACDIKQSELRRVQCFCLIETFTAKGWPLHRGDRQRCMCSLPTVVEWSQGTAQAFNFCAFLLCDRKETPTLETSV